MTLMDHIFFWFMMVAAGLLVICLLVYLVAFCLGKTALAQCINDRIEEENRMKARNKGPRVIQSHLP